MNNHIEKKQLKTNGIVLLVTAIIIIITLTIYSYSETPIQKTKEIKTSSIYKYCDPNFNCKDKSFIEKFFYPTIADLSIEKINFNKEKNTLTVNTKLTSEKRNIEKEYKFTIKDNSGPYIESTNCKFTDTEEIDLTKCFTITDYNDGVIDSKNAKITNNNDLTKLGTYTINVSATDKDKFIEKKDIKVEIVKTPITLNVNISKTSIQICSSSISTGTLCRMLRILISTEIFIPILKFPKFHLLLLLLMNR